MAEVPCFQVVLSITAEAEAPADALEAAAEVVLRAVERDAAFVALGPIVSVDFNDAEIEVECTVGGESPDDIHGKCARITQVMLEAANAFEYTGSSTQRLEPAVT
jgi:hypothetical protein